MINPVSQQQADAYEQRARCDETLGYARNLANRLNAAIWACDTADSVARKAHPGTGYRSHAKLGDAPWDQAACAAAIFKSRRELRALLRQLGL